MKMQRVAVRLAMAAVMVSLGVACGPKAPPNTTPTPPGDPSVTATPTPNPAATAVKQVISVFCPKAQVADGFELMLLVDKCGKYMGELRKLAECVCTGRTPNPPTATPTMATPTPPAAVTPTNPGPVVATPTPVVVWVQPDKEYGKPGPGNPNAIGPVYQQEVIAAIDAYCPSHPDHCNPEGRKVKHGFQDAYYDGVVQYLQVTYGLEAWVDTCGGAGRCGEIQVAAPGTKFKTGWAEGYHVLTSPGPGAKPPMFWSLDTHNFMGRSEPKWWTSKADWNQAPTAAPVTPTPVIMAKCPPILEVGANRKNGSPSFPGNDPTQPGKVCWLIDQTGKFNVFGDGRKVPCNKEKWANCGVAGGGVDMAGNQVLDSGDKCEPRPQDLKVTMISTMGPKTNTGDYEGKVCGLPGSQFTVIVEVVSGALDKGGRPIDMSQYLGPFTYRGQI